MRFLAELHGHLGWLAAAALLHPAILLRDSAKWIGSAAEGNRKPLAHALVVVIAAALVSVAAIAGALVYGPYREAVRPLIFASAPVTGWLFERKEHLAVGAAALAWAGVFSAVAARRANDDALRAHLARSAHFAFVGAAVLTFVTAAFGTWVASVRSF